jgi:hypothetical protein
MYRQSGPGILEIKCVDWLVFRNQWLEVEGEQEAPPHIEIQVQHQLHCIERTWAALGVLVGGNSLKLFIRDYDPAVGVELEKATKAFMTRLARKQAPDPVLPADADLIAQIYNFGDPSKVVDAQDNAEVLALCTEYLDASTLISAYEDRKKTAKAKLLMLIGDASKVIVANGISISAGTVGDTVVETFTRKSYRGFRVTQKAKKEEKAA